MDNLIFIMAERGLIWNTIRSIFSWLDSVAYTFFSWIMQLIFDIASVSNDSALNGFYDNIYARIYAILAIFMLFKITLSMLNYLINPDAIADKERGIGKMGMRVVVSLVMLIAFPYAFQFLSRVQPHILEALPRIILGSNVYDASSNTYDVDTDMADYGRMISFQTYNGVFFNDNCGDPDAPSCFAYGDTVSDANEHINDPLPGDDNIYKYNYYPLVGFVTAVVMSLILLRYCVDIAIRVFKLIILQLIAPIPIISYIDPKSSKDGAFANWIKMVVKVWIDLFIKLGVIYFVILVIKELIASGVISNLTASLFGNNGNIRGGLVLVALIIGLLFFAKDAPKFIASALGIKMEGNGSLFGGLGKIMAAGSLAAGTIGAGIAAGKSSFMSDEVNGKNHNVGRVLKNVGAGLFGATTGFGASASAALNAKDHNAKAVRDTFSKRNETALARGVSGSTALGRTLSTTRGLFTGQTPADRMRIRSKELGDAFNSLKDYKTAVESRFDGNDDYDYSFSANGKTFHGNYNVTSRMVSAAQNGDADAQNWLNNHHIDAVWFTEHQDDIHKAGYETFANDVLSGNYADSTVIEKYKNTQNKIAHTTVDEYDSHGNKTGNKIDLGTRFNGSYKVSKGLMGSTSGTKGALERDSKYNAAMVDEKESKK